MSDDNFTEVTSRSWFSRLGGAIKGLFIGLLLFLAAFPLLFWNEGRAIDTRKGLDEGAGVVIEVAAQPVDTANNKRLVHVSGRVVGGGRITDEEFGLSIEALRLRRIVEVFQWREERRSETRKKLGGGEETVTTYDYRREWSSTHQDSSRFKHPAGHENPDSTAIEGLALTADKVSLGGFELTPSQVQRLNDFENVHLPADHPLPNHIRDRARMVDGQIFVGESPMQPSVGDMRISFQGVYPHKITVVAQQSVNSFAPYPTRSGGYIDLLERGMVTPEAMFMAAQSQNVMMTWMLRVGGFILMSLGLGMVLKPLSVVADIVPLFGDILEAGTGIVAGLIAAVLSIVTIAVAWLIYRPLFALLLIGVGVAIILATRAIIRRAHQCYVLRSLRGSVPTYLR